MAAKIQAGQWACPVVPFRVQTPLTEYRQNTVISVRKLAQ